jgi:hypothetical protein
MKASTLVTIAVIAAMIGAGVYVARRPVARAPTNAASIAPVGAAPGSSDGRLASDHAEPPAHGRAPTTTSYVPTLTGPAPRGTTARAIARDPDAQPVPPTPRVQHGPTDADLAEAAAATQPSIPEPMARAALSFVGVDPDAEMLWLAAINDPNLSSKDRSNLIEDLNEDGFPDPHHVTADDLPLIMSRLQLIEEAGPLAMDDVNAAAFDEAYKDLTEMLAKVQQEQQQQQEQSQPQPPQQQP